VKRNAVLMIALLAFGFGAISYAAYSSSKASEINLPISAKEALEILESNEKARVFIAENLVNESGRITRVNLKWGEDTDTYVWDIEIMERACGCKVGAMEGLNVLKAQIDPVTGEVLNITTRTGVKEETLSKERCMEGCHEGGMPKPLMESEV
jgi:hypothetical protein